MSKPEWLQDLEARSGGRTVLLVEGNVDTGILAHFLTQISPGWDARIVLLPARFKSRVIEAIRDYHHEWAGIVDIDEWSPDDVQKELENATRIKTLPRFCLENYFCVPEELWNALPPVQRQAIDNDPHRLARPILEQLPDWVAHGAMWRVIRGRRRGLLHESGFPAKLDHTPITDLNEIRAILTAWHEQLDPEQIIGEYREELKKAQRLTPDEQLKRYIHGKKFFKQVITHTLNELFGQPTTGTWLQRLSRPDHEVAIPADLREFLTDVLASLG